MNELELVAGVRLDAPAFHAVGVLTGKGGAVRDEPSSVTPFLGLGEATAQGGSGQVLELRLVAVGLDCVQYDRSYIIITQLPIGGCFPELDSVVLADADDLDQLPVSDEAQPGAVVHDEQIPAPGLDVTD